MNPRRVRTFGCALALVLGPTPVARAQGARISGLVRDSVTAAPVAGAVVSIIDSARKSLARTFSNEDGRYALPLPDGAAQLRIVRIGYQPRVIPLNAKRDGAAVVDVRMSHLLTLLSTYSVSDDQTCSPGNDRRASLSLWEQARAGLLTSVVAREALPTQAFVMSYQRVLDDSAGRVVSDTHHMGAGVASRPFFSAEEPESLAVHGYVKRTEIGPVFEAPDADVLLDDHFAATHCFSVRQSDAAHAGAIGLAFEPAPGRTALIDVGGTLWMDAGTPALRSLEFSYIDRDTSLKRAGAGGSITFRTMPNGVVFIDEWTLRLPVVDTTNRVEYAHGEQVGFLGRRRLPLQTSETGGVVLHAAWTDGSSWQAPMRPLVGIVATSPTGLPFANALVTLAATHDTVVTDSAGQFSIFPILPGRYTAEIIDTAFSTFVAPRSSEEDVSIVHGERTEVQFDLPDRELWIRSLCKGRDSLARTSILLGRMSDSTGNALDTRMLNVAASWNSVEKNQARELRTVAVDLEGRFTLCDAPRELPVLLTSRRFGFPIAQTFVNIDAATDISALQWTFDDRAASGSLAKRFASVRGRVTREGTKSGIGGVEVWLPVLNRHATTDSSGAFRIDSLSLGEQIIQVRELGYTAKRDVVKLTEGKEIVRDFTLQPAVTLDAMHTVSRRYNTPGLRGFEDRRLLNEAGFFISDSTLRDHDRESLANIITSRVPGVKLVNVWQESYLANSQKVCSTGNSACTPCYVTIYIDGLVFYSPRPGLPPTDVSRISVSELAGVEFYRNASSGPVQYRTGSSECGTLLLWTREK